MNLREQIREDLVQTIDNLHLTIDKAQVEVTRTGDPKFGDYSTNVAMRLTSPVIASEAKQSEKEIASSSSTPRNDKGKNKQSALEIARILADKLRDLPYIEKVEVAEPGFINFFIKPEVWQKEVEDVLKLGDGFGGNDSGKGKKARVEFVSANPTGPLHFGNARGGPIGDSLASVLEFCGYEVVREYYHNDVGEQVRKLGESIANVAEGHSVDEQEYKGQYIVELAKKILQKKVLSSVIPVKAGIYKTKKLDPHFREDDKRKGNGSGLDSVELGKKAVEILLKEILTDCEAMGIKFDKFYSESELVKSGETKAVVDTLRQMKVLKENEGALWFAPKDEFLKDRETVVIKSDGSYTYFANDIALHNLKFRDKCDLVIDVFGANMHGHLPRIKAAIVALGHDISKYHVILYQWVRFKRGGELVKMSKRAGTFITAREVLDEVGKDALRFFILMYDPNSHIDFDLDLAKERSNKNPVYYVQYAHARIASILAKAKIEQPFAISHLPLDKAKSEKLKAKGENTNYNLLATNYELDVIKQITRLPELVEDIAQNFAVHRLTAYSTELADSFHRFYENCRVIGEKEDLMQARFALISATKIALENTLSLLGVSAPEKM